MLNPTNLNYLTVVGYYPAFRGSLLMYRSNSVGREGLEEKKLQL